MGRRWTSSRRVSSGPRKNAMRGPFGTSVGPSRSVAPSFEAADVGLDVGGVEAEMFQSMMRGCVAGPELLVGARP